MGTPKGRLASSSASAVNLALKPWRSTSPFTYGCSLAFSRRASSNLRSCDRQYRQYAPQHMPQKVVSQPARLAPN